MTAIDPETHVATLVLERPGRARIFERYEIDYCCGGKVALAEACEARGLELEAVVAALEEPPGGGADEVDWTARPLSELCAHIVDYHHGYLRDELPRLRLLTSKVARAHEDGHPELAEVETVFAGLADELEQHMAKEEQILFPACVALEQGASSGYMSGSVESPIRVMLHEHDEVGEAVARLHALTGGYALPADACNSYRALLDRLETLELDLHRHIHEENNVLFPRALALESRADETELSAA
jgi:regulator of cell morphogenesis and NO signaling